MPKFDALDYLAIGHIAQDLQPDGGYALGGTVAFAGLLATALGLRTGVLTSAAPAADLSALDRLAALHVVPAGQSTVFENRYSAMGRTQFLHSRATPLTTGQWPGGLPPKIVHLAPIANEVDLAWLGHWPAAFVGLTLQGWLRVWGADGRVRRGVWPDAAGVLGQVDAAILSEEDVDGDWALLEQWAAWSRVLVVTRGANGARVFAGGKHFDVPAPAVDEVDPTGAGDVFATTFFCAYYRTGTIEQAAKQAVQYASYWVTQTSLTRIQFIAEAAGSGTQL